MLFRKILSRELAMVAAGVASDIKDAAHRLKGSLATIGARDAHAACVSLETYAREARVSECAMALANLDAHIEIAQQAIKNLIRK